MSLRIVLLNSAEQDLEELRDYITHNFSAKTWRTTYTKLKKTIRTLQNFPQAGSIPEEIAKLNLTQYRQVLSDMNRIIYEVRKNVVYVHMVVDAGRDMPALLMRRLLRMH